MRGSTASQDFLIFFADLLTWDITCFFKKIFSRGGVISWVSIPQTLIQLVDSNLGIPSPAVEFPTSENWEINDFSEFLAVDLWKFIGESNPPNKKISEVSLSKLAYLGRFVFDP